MVDAYTFVRVALNGLAERPLPEGVRLKVEIDPGPRNEVTLRAYWVDRRDRMRSASVRWRDGSRVSVADALLSLRGSIEAQVDAHGPPRVF